MPSDRSRRGSATATRFDARKALLGCALALVSVACGTSDAGPGTEPPNDDGGDASGGGDADGSNPVEADAGPPCDTPSVLGPVGRSTEGVLTNHPEFHFTKTGGVLDVTSAYFDMLVRLNFTSLEMFGDVVNNTRTQQCVPYTEQFDVAMQALVAGVDGPAYQLAGSMVTLVCLDPGARGIFHAIQNNVPATLLDAAGTVSYSFTAYATSPPNRRHPDDPVLGAAAPVSSEAGWALGGRMNAGPGDINTLEMRVYVRDTSGVVFALLMAKPGDLHTIAARSSFDFETDPSEARFCSFDLFNLFIDGPEPPMPDAGPSDAADDPAGD